MSENPWKKPKWGDYTEAEETDNQGEEMDQQTQREAYYQAQQDAYQRAEQ